MGVGYLMDSNTITDYLLNRLPSRINILIESDINKLSVISRIEVLVWKSATPAYLEMLELFIANSKVYDLDEAIILEAINVRKKYKIKLPDAIIAATAIVYKLVLITNNLQDFSNIKNLKTMGSFSV